jgi:hypothetical protein
MQVQSLAAEADSAGLRNFAREHESDAGYLAAELETGSLAAAPCARPHHGEVISA